VITGGALRCAHCETARERRWRGYLPLWDDAATGWVVVFGAEYSDNAVSLTHLDPVVCMKVARRGSPIRVDSLAWTQTKPPLRGGDTKPQDVRTWLLRVWKDDVLTRWVVEHDNIPSDTAVSLVTPDHVITPTTALTDAAAGAQAAGLAAARERASRKTPPAESIADVLAQVPALNGVHRRKPK
jgi:hypothetical protein